MTTALDRPATANSWEAASHAGRPFVTGATRNQDDPQHLRWRQSGSVSRGSAASRWVLLQSALAQLERLQELSRGWDSYGGESVDAGAADLMSLVLSALVQDFGPTPQLTPLGDGGVQVEWRVNGAHLEIEADADRTLRFFAREVDGTVDIDDEEVSPQFARPYLLRAHAMLAEMSEGVAHRRPQ